MNEHLDNEHLDRSEPFATSATADGGLESSAAASAEWLTTQWPEQREFVVSRIARWLDNAASTPAGQASVRRLLQAMEGAPGGLEPTESGVGTDAALSGLVQIVGDLTALRHELKLQTKTGRVSLEALSASSQRLDDVAREVFERLTSLPSLAPNHEEPEARILVESLAEADEAVGRLVDALAASAARPATSPPLLPRLSWWNFRQQVARYQEAVQRDRQDQGDIIKGLAEGARMLVERLHIQLQRCQVARIDQVGVPVDPRTMQVLEVTRDSHYPGGVVVRVLRPGYAWRSRLLRPAQVVANANQ
jgi:hypothetical protein